MQNKIKLSIPKPCSENWNNFISTPDGNFCNSCSKIVIDFTKMNDEEIHAFFTKRPSYACGRFRPDQIKTYSNVLISHNYEKSPGWIKAGIFSLLFIFTSKPGSANVTLGKAATVMVQSEKDNENHVASNNPGHKIKGRVIDEYNEPLPGVRVYLKGTSTGTSTDNNGEFTFYEELEPGDVLVFNYIGFITKEYVVPRHAPKIIDIPMVMDYLELMGEVSVDGPYTETTGTNLWWQKLKSLFQ